MKIVPINAVTIAQSIVISAGHYGVDPIEAVTAPKRTPPRRCLVAAAAGLQIASNCTASAAAKAIGCDHTMISINRRDKPEGFIEASEAVIYELIRLFGVEAGLGPRRLRKSTVAAFPSPAPAHSPPAADPAAPAAASAVAPANDQVRQVAQIVPGRSFRVRKPTQRTVRYARRFLTAGWRMDEVAGLFDADPDDLDAALKAA